MAVREGRKVWSRSRSSLSAMPLFCNSFSLNFHRSKKILSIEEIIYLVTAGTPGVISFQEKFECKVTMLKCSLVHYLPRLTLLQVDEDSCRRIARV